MATLSANALRSGDWGVLGAGFCGGAALGAVLGWLVLVGPNPGPQIHRAFAAIIASALLCAAGGAGSALLAWRLLRGGPTRSLYPVLGGAVVACGGLVGLALFREYGPLLTKTVTCTRNADGTFTDGMTSWDPLVFGGLLLAGSALALWGWRR